MTPTSLPRIAALLCTAALAITLAACSPTDPGAVDDGSGATPASGTDDAAGSPTSCVVGTWNADVDDLAAQLGTLLTDTGMNVVTTRAAGTQSVSFTEDGGFRFDNDLALAVDVQVSDGPAMTVAQSHIGATTASWAWDASATEPAMVFEDFDRSSYAIENSVSMGDASSTVPIDLPVETTGEGRLFVDCSGDRLTTHWDQGLFTTSWRR